MCIFLTKNQIIIIIIKNDDKDRCVCFLLRERNSWAERLRAKISHYSLWSCAPKRLVGCIG